MLRLNKKNVLWTKFTLKLGVIYFWFKGKLSITFLVINPGAQEFTRKDRLINPYIFLGLQFILVDKVLSWKRIVQLNFELFLYVNRDL